MNQLMVDGSPHHGLDLDQREGYDSDNSSVIVLKEKHPILDFKPGNSFPDLIKEPYYLMLDLKPDVQEVEVAQILPGK